MTITRNFLKYISADMGYFLLGTQERVRNSRGKRAISVRAIKVLSDRLSERDRKNKK